MVLRIKNFYFLGVHWKIRLLGGGGSRKTIIEGGLAKKGACIVCRFKGAGFGKKEGDGVFDGGWYPNAHYEKVTDVLAFLRLEATVLWAKDINWASYLGLIFVLYTLGVRDVPRNVSRNFNKKT